MSRNSSVSSVSSNSSAFSSKLRDSVKNLPRAVQNVTQMLLDKVGCDMKLYCREEKSIQCHSFMLWTRCPKMLTEYNLMKEVHKGETWPLVTLTDYSHKTVTEFLWYVYTGQCLNQNDEKLMTELKELTESYDMPLILDKSNELQISATEKQKQAPSTRSLGVQTEMETRDVTTMTDSACQSSAETGFGSLEQSKESQELFTTFCEDKGTDTSSSAPEPTVIVKEQAHLSNNSVLDENFFMSDDDNDDNHSGGDLFEDLENDLNESLDQPQELKPENKADDITAAEVSSDSRQQTVIQVTLSEEEYRKELESPATQRRKNSERKRSRSPLLDETGDFYSATQVAYMLEKNADKSNTSMATMIQATKKQKLDNDNGKVKSVGSEGSKCELNISDINDPLGSDCDFGMECDDDEQLFLNIDNNGLLETPKSRLSQNRSKLRKSRRRSTSTPNLFSTSSPTNFETSPFPNQQISQNSDTELDPFANDSVFANIPEEFLAKGITPEVTSRNIQKNFGASKCTTQTSLTPLSSSRRRLPPVDLSPQEDSLTSKPKKGAKKGGRSNAKAPKIKLPSRLPPIEDHTCQDSTDTQKSRGRKNKNTSLSQSQQPPPSNESTTEFGGNNKSPMLNYSLIDTPVLKVRRNDDN